MFQCLCFNPHRTPEHITKNGGLLSHRGTPSYHPYFSGIFHGQKQSSERPGIVHGKPGPSGQQPDGVLVNLQWLKYRRNFARRNIRN